MPYLSEIEITLDKPDDDRLERSKHVAVLNT